jgi:hypothetical protein
VYTPKKMRELFVNPPPVTVTITPPIDPEIGLMLEINRLYENEAVGSIIANPLEVFCTVIAATPLGAAESMTVI